VRASTEQRLELNNLINLACRGARAQQRFPSPRSIRV